MRGPTSATGRRSSAASNPSSRAILGVTMQRAVELVGIQPAETPAAPVQLDVALDWLVAEQRRQEISCFLARPLPRGEVDVDGRHPGAPPEGERIEPGKGPPLALDEALEVRRHRPFGRRPQTLPRRHLEPQIGHAGREGDDPAERGERHEEEAALDDVLAEIERKPELTGLHRRGEHLRGQLFVSGFASALAEALAEVPRQLGHDPAQVRAAGLGPVEEQRPAAVTRQSVVGLGGLDVDRNADYHSPSREAMRSESCRPTAADRASSIDPFLAKRNRFLRTRSTRRSSQKS